MVNSMKFQTDKEFLMWLHPGTHVWLLQWFDPEDERRKWRTKSCQNVKTLNDYLDRREVLRARFPTFTWRVVPSSFEYEQ